VFGTNVLKVNERGIREGLILRSLHKHGFLNRRRKPRDWRTAVRDFARSCHVDESHGEQVAGLALRIFDALAKPYGLEERGRQLLEALRQAGNRVPFIYTSGYTAIEAAKTAEHVTTVELDPVAQGIARLNPWSQALFNNPKITQLIGDSFEEIEHFADETFSCIIHDPPTFSLAGDLYSAEFYRQSFRVLKRRGRMFHYIGDPESKSGSRVAKGVVRRLQEAGFTRVVSKPQAFGVAAYK